MEGGGNWLDPARQHLALNGVDVAGGETSSFFPSTMKKKLYFIAKLINSTVCYKTPLFEFSWGVCYFFSFLKELTSECCFSSSTFVVPI